MVSRSSSKSKSRSTENLANFNLKLSMSGERKAASRVSWKPLRKQYPWLKQLKKHQRRGTEAIVSTNGFAALFAQRTGKTWVTGAALCVLKSESQEVLLVGLKTNLKSTWVKFLNEKLPWYSVHLDLKSYDEHKKKYPNAYRVLLVNREKLKPIKGRLIRRKWDWLIWDEAQVLKNRTSQASRDAYQIARSAKRRLALTGTPMDLDPKDLWAIMRFIAPQVLGETWKDFEKEFLKEPSIDMNKKMGIVQRKKMMLAYQIAKRKAPVKKSKLKKLAKLISPHVMRISKADAGMTSANIHKVIFNLDEEENKKYRKLEKTMVVKQGGVTIKTPLKITQIGKLQQITGGHIKDEEGEVHRVGTSKRRQLRKLINENIDGAFGTYEPFVIFCKYVWEVHMLERMMLRMGFPRVAKLWGKVKDIKTDPRRTNMLLAFQRGEIDVIICQQRTGGVGVDLYRARKAFVYSFGHSFIDWDQMISRLDFLEQNEPADIFILLADFTIDIDIVSGVERKQSITERFYSRLSKHR